jgi:hypothetical protein
MKGRRGDIWREEEGGREPTRTRERLREREGVEKGKERERGGGVENKPRMFYVQGGYF